MTAAHDRFNCDACAASMTYQPSALPRPFVSARLWDSKGPLDETEDPCGRPPMTTISNEGEAA